MEVVLPRRLARWAPETPEELLAVIFSFVATNPPLELMCIVLRVILYGCCATVRFCNEPASCLLGCGVPEGE